MINNLNINKVACVLINISVFLFFSFFLSVKGAQSWAMLGALIAALLAFWAAKISRSREEKILVGLFLLLAVFWGHSFDSWLAWTTEGDFFVKYALGAFCALVLPRLKINPRLLSISMGVGAFTAGLLAIYQFPIIGRSEGFTNAIRFGDIAIYLGMACWIFLLARPSSKAVSAGLLLAGGMGMVASLLSLSRGGWPILLCLPLLVLHFVPSMRHRVQWFAGLCLALVLVGAVAWQVPALQKRTLLAEQEISGYFEQPEKYVQTSIGARLEQWRLSWALGSIKPLTGWGEKGYYQGREHLISEGRVSPFLREINHSHNDFLDMWAKRGIVGVGFLFLIYAIPLYIFYPTKKRVACIEESEKKNFIAMSLVGVMLPVSYFIFGWTDVFFNLTIGHNFYIFSLIFILAAVNAIRKNHSVSYPVREPV